MGRDLGPWIVGAGLVLVLVGVLAWTGVLSWFGRLPGDIRIEGDRTRVYFPLVSMIVASIVLTIVVNVVTRWFR